MTSRVRVSILALTFASIVALPSLAAAQDKAVIGVKGGINIAKVSTEDDEGISTKTGAVGGLFISKAITSTVGIRGEGLFSQKGAKGEEDGTDLTFRLNYVDVPVLLTLSPSSSGDARFSFFTGPQFSFNIKAEAEAEVDGTTLKQDLDDEIKGTDLGWVLGVGVDKGRFSADARYTLGLTNIASDGDNLKNRVFSVMIGVKLTK